MLLFFVGRSSEDGTIAPGAAHRRLLLRECPALGHQHLHILATRITRKNVTCLEQQIRDIEQKLQGDVMLRPFSCTQLTIEHSGKLPWSPQMMISKKSQVQFISSFKRPLWLQIPYLWFWTPRPTWNLE